MLSRVVCTARLLCGYGAGMVHRCTGGVAMAHMSTRRLLMRDWVAMTSTGRTGLCLRHLRSWYHSYARRRQPTKPHLLLYGAVAFVWEKERIPNEDVMSCVKSYLERMSADLRTSVDEHNNPSLSLPPQPPLAPSQSSPASQQSSPSWLHSWLSSPASPPPQGQSSSSQSNTAQALSYFTRAQGLFWWSADSTSEEDTVPSVSPSSTSSSYFTWAQSWLSSWSVPTSNHNDAQVTSVDGAMPPAESATLCPVEESADAVAMRKREEFMQECLRYYRAHREDNMGRLPRVGIIKNRNQFSQIRRGLHFLEQVEEKTRSKLQHFLHHGSLQLPGASSGVDGNFKDDPSASLCDLSCVEYSAESSEDQHTSHHSGNWVDYMLLDLEDQQVSPLPLECANTLLNRMGVPDHTKHKLTMLSRSFLPILDSLASLVPTSHEYLKNQLMDGESFCADLHVGETFADMAHSARKAGIALLTEVLERFGEDGVGLGRYGYAVAAPSTAAGGGGGYGGTMVTAEEKVCVEQNRGGVCAVDKEDSPATCEVTYEDNRADQWGWELVNESRNYTTYRKFYKDTGLFQYKVLGMYDDITAKNFFDAQMDQDFRKTWDAYANNVVTVDRDPESNCSLIHWVMKYPFPMSSREYLFVQRSWISSADDTIVIINRSTSHPSFPEQRGYVRVGDYFSEMVIKSRSKIEELGMDFELTYFDDPKTQLPSSCVNWVASSAMPDYMSKIHNAALTRQNDKC